MTSGNKPEFFKKYVGQSCHVATRLAQHERAQFSSQSLFHFAWRRPDEGRHVQWIRLGRRTGPEVFEDDGEEEEEAMWMNIVEMFYALALQSLSEVYLERWAPDAELVQPHAGLNVALPLHQGLLTAEVCRGLGFGHLHNSSDPEQVAYAQLCCTKGGLNAWEAAETNNAYETRGATLFAQGNLHHLKRRRLPQEPFPEIQCKKCGQRKLDDNPYYTVADNKYLDERGSTCQGTCEPSEARRRSRSRCAITVHRATDPNLDKISQYRFHLKYFGKKRATGH
ncbi:hypothetical protein MN608_02000 [Microdochium nivale]|nr:hypothetical protein MN608_02000 [Microdochium nivale]